MPLVHAGGKGPGDLQIFGIGGVDLIEIAVTRALVISRRHRPLAIVRRRLREGGGGREKETKETPKTRAISAAIHKRLCPGKRIGNTGDEGVSTHAVTSYRNSECALAVSIFLGRHGDNAVAYLAIGFA